MSSRITRRNALSLLAVSATGMLVSREAFAQAAVVAPSKLITDADVCVITPETTEGPYYFDPNLERTDVTEGRPGLPTVLKLQVVDEVCRPLAGARVDIWHCDATGIYSGYAGQPGDVDATGETFMRGTQLTGADGVASFETVYPGWYPGRTPHVHFKVFLDQTTVLTGQLFFPDDVSDQVYASGAPYLPREGQQARRNADDGIARRAGDKAMAQVEPLPEGYLVQMILGVEPLGQFGGMSFPASG
jgi:protocatechuate 3,4-dioxygenase beta subunit